MNLTNFLLLDVERESNLSTLYTESSNGKYVPRALFVDFEPTVVDEIRHGEFADLYNPQFMITGKVK